MQRCRRRLASQPWMAGDRFTIADITAFCGIEFARLVRFKPGDAGLTHLRHGATGWPSVERTV